LTSFKFLSFGIAALATLALSSPLEAVERNSSPVTVAITTDGACANSNPFLNKRQVTPGKCQSFGGANYGALVKTGSEQCVFKFWTNSGCSGQATTWYAPPNSDSHCIPIANNGGSFKLTAGVSSVIVNCAEDQVP
ncbi:hypothetical protein N431DRAFT_311900, partial [Stipitochalara longipes BDJ]